MARKDLVARIGRLAKAVAISDRKGDDPGVEKWSVRLADASTSLAVMVNPALAEEEEELAAVAALGKAPFDGPPIDPAYFVPVADAGDDVYIAGLEGGLSGEGVDWTLNRAIAWFKYVWTNGIAYHAVAPGLLPGSHCLSPEGYKFAVEFQRRDDLTVAPRDFNPLDLLVKV